jgi:hypothetical protein
VILIRAIAIFLLLTASSFAAASSAYACTSTTISASQHGAEVHGLATMSVAEQWQSSDSSTRYCPSHGGNCADLNCGYCYSVATVASPTIVVPLLSLDEQARVSAITTLEGRDVAPETGPPKSVA